MQKASDITFREFLKIFPQAELPVVLSSDSLIDFSRENVAFPPPALEKYLHTWDQDYDELVEFIPCFKFKMEKDITALVYCKASLLRYEYFLITVDKKENLLAQKIIAGLISNGEKTIQSAATITADYCIHIAGGYAKENELFDGISSKQNYMEIMPDGSIVSIQDTEDNDKNKQEKK